MFKISLAGCIALFVSCCVLLMTPGISRADSVSAAQAIKPVTPGTKICWQLSQKVAPTGHTANTMKRADAATQVNASFTHRLTQSMRFWALSKRLDCRKHRFGRALGTVKLPAIDWVDTVRVVVCPVGALRQKDGSCLMTIIGSGEPPVPGPGVIDDSGQDMRPPPVVTDYACRDSATGVVYICSQSDSIESRMCVDKYGGTWSMQNGCVLSKSYTCVSGWDNQPYACDIREYASYNRCVDELGGVYYPDRGGGGAGCAGKSAASPGGKG